MVEPELESRTLISLPWFFFFFFPHSTTVSLHFYYFLPLTFIFFHPLLSQGLVGTFNLIMIAFKLEGS